MHNHKQQLLKRHRKQKRLILVAALLVILVSGFWHWWLIPCLLVVFWIVHEAWLSDHLFYLPNEDYRYQFPETAKCFTTQLVQGALLLTEDQQQQISSTDTLLLKIRLQTSWLGRLFDPSIVFADDQQTFERSAKGVRYLNLTGQHAALVADQLVFKTQFCRLEAQVELIAFAQPDFTRQSIMVLAPHADDAELAAYGVYSSSENKSVITITQGEIEAENYQVLGLTQDQAAKLKGRLRAWDSIMIPQWGGVKAENTVQLGYYCLQLNNMQSAPEQAFGSKASKDSDIRCVRNYNSIQLTSDATGTPSWQNLVQDLVEVLAHFKPDVVITPHPTLDPHADHVATTAALYQALETAEHKPENLLFYANHLHDNDRWPMGNAGDGVALPPAMRELEADSLWAFNLTKEQQLDKAMALAMQHDLQPAMPLKKRVRRYLQHYLLGRRWPATGENEFFRKAVRRHELFWVRSLK
ncbi:PIG-L family deacetylase [Pseudomonas sp. F1_0610]|uniref:PIG-L deacetylase family protein n=1 Tax=Pseudomonas sp. F1_0610 TaxID=3114284 RepID=UPI0039C44D3F